MKKFFVDNSLSLTLMGLFVVFMIGLALSGFAYDNEQLKEHGQVQESFAQFLTGPTFSEAVFENWESEFLQMGALVVLTIWLVQKGAADSKEPSAMQSPDTSSRYSIIKASSWRRRAKAAGNILYVNSLSIALFGLFLFSFVMHGISGTAAANQEASWHGAEQQSVIGYMASSQFWFESFQNWQSEFLAVAVLLILSIFLRQRQSPESKPVTAPAAKTGE